MNKIIIKGRLVRDPELETAGSGMEFCKFSVAVDRRKVKDKEQQTDFFDCTAFGNTGVAISKYFGKGKEILVEGRMESNRVAKDDTVRTYWGVTVDTFEFCGSKSDAAAPSPVDPASGMEVTNTEELPF
jgi:single-strand DNA-binding protein